MDLYLIRHTRPQIEAGVCYGQLEVPLAPTSAEDSRTVAARLPTVEAVWTSPLARCFTLAEAIGSRMGVVPVADQRLCELKFGDWEGRRWQAIDRGEIARWAENYWSLAPPSGETYRALYERVALALSEILAQRARCIAVVTHAGPIRAALAQCLRLEPTRYPAIELDCGGINLLRAEKGGWRIGYLNG